MWKFKVRNVKNQTQRPTLFDSSCLIGQATRGTQIQLKKSDHFIDQQIRRVDQITRLSYLQKKTPKEGKKERERKEKKNGEEKKKKKGG